MMRLLFSACAIVILLSTIGCGNDGLVMPKEDDSPINPPKGTNPGSNYYQLQVNIELDRDIGNAPLPVTMNAVVKGGKAPYYYRWDVTSDGRWDYGGIGIYEVGVKYLSAGVYRITLEVEDSNEQFYRTSTQIQVLPSGPSAMPKVKPIIGYAPLSVELDGSDSFDRDGDIVLYEWDFTSDGVYDYESEDEPVTTADYESPGTYNATLRVTDNDGFTDVASVQIVVL